MTSQNLEELVQQLSEKLAADYRQQAAAYLDALLAEDDPLAALRAELEGTDQDDGPAPQNAGEQFVADAAPETWARRRQLPTLEDGTALSPKVRQEILVALGDRPWGEVMRELEDGGAPAPIDAEMRAKILKEAGGENEHGEMISWRDAERVSEPQAT